MNRITLRTWNIVFMKSPRIPLSVLFFHLFSIREQHYSQFSNNNQRTTFKNKDSSPFLLKVQWCHRYKTPFSHVVNK